MLQHEFYGRNQILLKPVAQTGPLIVEVGDSFVGFSLGRLEKPRPDHFLRARSRANTSSAGTASMFPALYSAYRRSASCAQS